MADDTDHSAHRAPETGAAGTSACADGADPTEEVVVHRAVRLSRPAYRCYRALLVAFAEYGAAPDDARLRELAARFGVPLAATLANFAVQDLVQRDAATGAIRAAYPFSGVPTAHRVALLGDGDEAPEVQVYAMCALDALGIPLMLRRKALITSTDVLTGEAVRVLVHPSGAGELAARERDGGLAGWVTTWEPSTAVVYARPEEYATRGGVAAGYRCPVTNFFATAEHSEQWRASHGSPEDVVLTHEEAFQRAHRRFSGILERLEDADGDHSSG